MTQTKDRRQFLKVLLFITVLTAVKLIVSTHIPILPLVYANADDAWAVNLADSFSRLRWLGPYNHMTLIKRIGFPVFLGILFRLHIPYTAAVTVLYSIGTGIFAWGLFPLYHDKLHGWKQVVFFLCLALVIFNPSTWSLAGLQRIYRNSITAFQLLWVMGGFFGLYFRRNAPLKKQLLIMIFGISFPAVWFLGTREDSLYLYVFLLTAAVILAAGYIRIFRKEKQPAAFLYKRLALFLIPAFLIFITPQCVRLVNKMVYGIATVTELSDSHFSDCMEAIYSIDMPEDESFLITVPHVKFDKVAEVSPAFATIKPELDELYETWIEWAPVEGERVNGLVFWYVREAAARHGYYANAVMADSFYKTCAEEINAAFQDGRLTKKKQKAVSALIPPFGPEILPDTFRYTGEAVKWVMDFEDCKSLAVDDGYPDELVHRFEVLSNCQAMVDEMPESYHKACAFTETYRGIYKIVHSVCLLISLAGYVWLIVLCIIQKVRKKTLSEGSSGVLLSALALILMFFLICGIVGFNSSVNVYSVGTIYLLGAYPMITIFIAMGIFTLAELIGKTAADRMKKKAETPLQRS